MSKTILGFARGVAIIIIERKVHIDLYKQWEIRFLIEGLREREIEKVVGEDEFNHQFDSIQYYPIGKHKKRERARGVRVVYSIF